MPSTYYVLAFDHRAVLESMYGVLDPDKVRDLKSMVFEALVHAVGTGRLSSEARCAYLVDEATGAHVFDEARGQGVEVILPVERSGAPTFTLDYGDEFLARIREVNPRQAKALLLMNPEGDRAKYDDQLARSVTALQAILDAGFEVMLEFMMPATETQLDSVGGDQKRYVAELRPALMRRVITDYYEAGLKPTVWKVEGLATTADYTDVAATIASFDPDARAIVLGGGADPAQVIEWLEQAAAEPVFSGFAIGRSVWEAGVTGYLGGSLDRDAALAAISAQYLEYALAYEAVRSAAVPATPAPRAGAAAGQ